MHVPFLQVAMEVIDLAAPYLAVELEWEENAALGGLIKMFKWFLGRCPKDAPPSANDVLDGPLAAKHLARAAGYMGDPNAFVAACCRVQPDPVLEKSGDGFRLCGLKRYDPYWMKCNEALAKAWKAKQETLAKQGQTGTEAEPEQSRPGTDPEPEQNRSSSDPEPTRHIQIQIQKKKKEEEEEKAATAKSSALLVTQEAARRSFVEWMVEKRLEELGASCPMDSPISDNGLEMLDWALSKYERQICEVAYLAFLGDSHWLTKDPPCPANAFLHESQLPQYLSQAARFLSEAAA